MTEPRDEDPAAAPAAETPPVTDPEANAAPDSDATSETPSSPAKDTESVDDGDLEAVQLLSRRSGPLGERVLIVAEEAFKATLVWADDSADTDATSWLADLVLAGWERHTETTAAPEPPTETVEVAHFEWVGTVAFVLLDGTGQGWEADADLMWNWARAGVTRMLVDGIAHEAAEDTPVPETAEGLH